jgi:NAD(P)-dependent dehydrogenase (short-subunit alcohol dehydrogenase family)
MIEAGNGGAITFISSAACLRVYSYLGHYAATKHGLVGLTRALALEWARRGIQVNALAPGFVDTSMMATVLADERAAAWIKRSTPMGRWADAAEMTGPAVFLASEASDFMTGQVLTVDGGWTAQ